MCLGHACNGTTFDNDFCNAQAVNTHVSRKMNARGYQYIKKTACNNIYSCFIFISQDEFHHHKTSSSSSPSKNGIGFVNKAKKTQQRLQRHKIQMEGVWKRRHTRDSHLWIVFVDKNTTSSFQTEISMNEKKMESAKQSANSIIR